MGKEQKQSYDVCPKFKQETSKIAVPEMERRQQPAPCFKTRYGREMAGSERTVPNA